MKLSTILSVLFAFTLFSCTQSCRNVAEEVKLHFSAENIGTSVALHFIDEEYHLFYTNDKASGIEHITSKNLINWENSSCNLEFLKNENFKTASIIRDWNSTVANDETLLAYVLKNNALTVYRSNDFGNAWEIWSDDILIDAAFETVNDIKVVWNDDIQQWVMLLLKDYDLEFFSSEDLKNWQFQSMFDTEAAVKKGDWTNVEFFPLEYTETFEIKWCLAISSNEGAANYGQGTQYFIGDFSDFQFSTDDDVKWMDAGTDYYAPIVLSDYLNINKLPVCIGNIDRSHALAFPRNLMLTRKFNEYFISSNPVNEINLIHNTIKQIAEQEFNGELSIKQTQQLPLEIDLTFDLNSRKYLDFAEVFGLIIENENKDRIVIGYHNLRRYFFISYNNEIVYAPSIIDQPEVEMKLIIDKSTVELFAMNGFVSMTKQYNSTENLIQIKLFTEGGKISLKQGTVCKLTSFN